MIRASELDLGLCTGHAHMALVDFERAGPVGGGEGGGRRGWGQSGACGGEQGGGDREG